MDPPANRSRTVPRSPASPGAGRGSSLADTIASTRAKVVFMLSVLRRWGALGIPLGVILAIVAGGFVWFSYEPAYEARAWIRIEDRRPVVLSGVKAQADSRKFVQTQVQLIRSPLVVGQVLNQPDIADLEEIKRAESPLDWITERLGVAGVGGSELYHIQFEGPNPQVASSVANTVVNAYMELHSQRDSVETQRLLELLEQEKERHSKDLERLQENVRVLTRQITGKDPLMASQGTGGQLVIAPTSADEQRLAAAEVDRQVLEVRLQAYEESLASRSVEIPATLVDEAIATNWHEHLMPGRTAQAEPLRAAGQWASGIRAR